MDRIVATQIGVRAADLAIAGEWGQMTAYLQSRVVPVALDDATARLKGVPKDLYEVAEVFFG
jgi:ATP-dependent phosphofructokinase / diphosphate-dependent phosphofructokinase